MDSNFTSGAADKGLKPGMPGDPTLGNTAAMGGTELGGNTASGAADAPLGGAAASVAGLEPGAEEAGNHDAHGEGEGRRRHGRHGHHHGLSLREELEKMKSDLDALVEKASSLNDQDLKVARDQMMAQFGSMRHRARGMARDAGQQLNQGVDATSDYVKEKPLQSVAMAAGLGLLIGAILRRH